MKPDSWLKTLNCAVEGVLQAVRTERHMRWHVLACLAVLLLAPRLAVTPAEFALLCLAAALVVVAELGNTAVEAVVDLASPGYHPLARAAKDVAAGAVLVAAFAAAAVGWVVLYPRLANRVEPILEAGNRSQPVALAALLLAVLVVVVMAKGLAGRGRSLEGGFPSGRAAVALALATVLALHTADLAVAVLAGVLALMVTHSRLLQRLHSHWDVLAGAALGTLSGALLFWLVF